MVIFYKVFFYVVTGEKDFPKYVKEKTYFDIQK